MCYPFLSGLSFIEPHALLRSGLNAELKSLEAEPEPGDGFRRIKKINFNQCLTAYLMVAVGYFYGPWCILSLVYF